MKGGYLRRALKERSQSRKKAASMSASVLSMDSPAFRPHASPGGGGGGTPSTNSTFATSPHHTRNRSGSNGSNGGGLIGGGNDEGHSNAVKSYSFQTPDGYVFI